VAVPPQDKYYDKLKGLALLYKVPVILDAEKLTAADLPTGTELVVAAHAHHYISQKLLAQTKYGGIGYHPSLLPRHRGRDAVRWAIAMHEPYAGGTVYRLSDKVDSGDILLQQFIHVGRSWDYHKLWAVLFPMGVQLLVEAVRLIETGMAASIPQDEQFASWEPAYDPTIRLQRNDLLQLGSADGIF
jgi:methionyl-tRNA formyltransferase